MATIIVLDHETGNLSQYTSTSGPDISVSGGPAALIGNYGLCIIIDDTTADLGRKSISPETSTTGKHRVRVWLDPNSLNMATTTYFPYLTSYNSSGNAVLVGQLRYTTAAGFNLYSTLIHDTGNANTSAYNITDDKHYIELYLQRASSPVASDGSLAFYIDGVLKETVTGRDNYDRFVNYQATYIGGVASIPATASGRFFLDDLAVNDDGGEIGNTTYTNKSAYMCGNPALRENAARDFNGTTDRIDWPSIANLTGGPLTISVWVNFDGSTDNQYMFTIHTAGNIYCIVFNLDDSGSGGFLNHSRAGATSCKHTSGASAVNDVGNWINLLATHDGTFTDHTTMHFYENGVEVPYSAPLCTNGVLPETDATGYWSLGGRRNDDTRNLDGKLGEVAVWNRVLASGEIGQVIVGDKSAMFIPSGLVFCVNQFEPRDLITLASGTLDGTSLAYGPQLEYPAITSKSAYLWGRVGVPYVSTAGTLVETKSLDTLHVSTAGVNVETKSSENLKVSTAGVIVEWQDLGSTSIYAYVEGKLSEQSSSSSIHAYLNGTGQYLVPISDITPDSWKNELDGSVLYPSLADPSDANYAWYDNSLPGAYFEEKLTIPSLVPSGNHYLRWRAYKKDGTLNVTLKCEVRQGITVIASDTQTLANSVTEYTYQLTSGEISNITDYSDLRVRVTIEAVS